MCPRPVALLAPPVSSAQKSVALRNRSVWQFVNETIDTGNLNNSDLNDPVASGRSPYGTWGGIGTRNGGEVIDDAF